MDTSLIPTHPASLSPFVDLQDDLRQSLEHTKSANTKRMYASAWHTFSDFCAARNVSALPAEVQTVAAYMEWLANHERPDVRKGRTGQMMKPVKVTTLDLHRAAIAYGHDLAKQPNPTKDTWLRFQMDGIRNKLADRAAGQTDKNKKQAAALPEIARLVATCDTNAEDPKHRLEAIRNKALLLVGFSGAFRRSELVAISLNYVRFVDDGMTITLPRSKTDQAGKGQIKHFPLMNDAALCPVQALRAWLDAAGIHSGYVFRSIDRWGNVGDSEILTAGMVARIIKDACKRAGMDHRAFSGHSLRRGFITEAARRGVSKHGIAAQTGHKPTSTTIDGYIEESGRDALNTVKTVFGQS